MASKAMKIVCVLSLFFSCSLWIGVQAVPQAELLTTTQQDGRFCYIVRSPDASPPGGLDALAIDEQILWGSAPALSLFMLVNVTLGLAYEATTGTVKVGAEHLTEGQHDLTYRLGISEGDKYYLDVLVDDESVPPQNTSSTYNLHDSSFISITVTSKGPIIYRWNQTCAEVVTSQPEPPGRRSSTVVHASKEETAEANQSKAVTVLLWIFIGIGSAGLLILLIVGISIFIQKTSNSRHKHLVRMAEAERQKQTITNAAQRLSYIEQIKWTADDRGGENTVRLMST